METGRGMLYRIPGNKVLVFCFIAAFKEICPESQAGIKLKIRHKNTNKADGDPKLPAPAAGDLKGC